MKTEYTDPSTSNTYDDGNIPEIDTPKPDNAVNAIPPEFGSNTIPKNEDNRPRKDGPGGE